MAIVLNDSEVNQSLAALPGWERKGDEIRKTYAHESFPEAIVFVNAVAHLAELMNHHPDIDIRYSNITLALTTHDQGGITAKDVTLAQQIEAIRRRAQATS